MTIDDSVVCELCGKIVEAEYRVKLLKLEYIGSPISFKVFYCYDLNDEDYNKLEIHSTMPKSRVLSIIDIGKISLLQKEPLITLSSKIQFNYKDDLNNIRKDIAMQLLNPLEMKNEPIGEI